MPEGGIYVCDWTKTKSGYSLALRSNPDIVSTGPNLDKCMEDICLQIVEWNGDGESVLELFPPPGGNRLTGGAVLFSSIAYNHDARAVDYASLFDGGACPVCKFGLGNRSAATLRIESPPQGIACAIHACYPILMVFHTKFVDSLTDEERAAFEIRPVFFGGRKSDYSELIAKKTIRTVGYKGADYPTAFHQSWRCNECGREKFEVVAAGFKPNSNFIDACEIDGSGSTMIVIDDGWRHIPAFRLARWKQLLAKKDLDGLLSESVVALDSDYVETPRLETCQEFDWIM
jgi:hypothetical protein